MSLIKRLSATVTASLDQLVGEIENHDAVVDATVQDMQKKIARAKVRLARLEKEKDRLHQQCNEQQTAADTWRQRAVDTARSEAKSTDQSVAGVQLEEKALACLERAKQHDEQIASITTTVKQYQATSEKLSRDVNRAEQQLAEVKQKQVMMRARQSTSQAVNATNRANNDDLKTLDDTFDRWEINILESEIGQEDGDLLPTAQLTDELERSFVQEEKRQALADELAQLMREDKGHD